ncbi:MAG: hypothetical protein FWD42_06835, partial [Solirubrobacterales bacterium]|nr:hypothetical protein [Solirubrobacterales bacterium]
VDGANHVALVAMPADQPERIIGVARFVRLPEEPRVAEFAVVIGDPWQREGLALELLARLLPAATARDQRGLMRLHVALLRWRSPVRRAALVAQGGLALLGLVLVFGQ